MKEELLKPAVQVKKSAVPGYGVFACRNFKPGEIIEECCVLFFERTTQILHDHCFINQGRAMISLGNGCLYNHSKFPNAEYYLDVDNDLLIFKALRPITKGEELLIYYGDAWFKNRGYTEEQVPVFRSFKKRIAFPALGYACLFIVIIFAGFFL